jgi:hypothetical protein
MHLVDFLLPKIIQADTLVAVVVASTDYLECTKITCSTDDTISTDVKLLLNGVAPFLSHLTTMSGPEVRYGFG